MSVEIAQAKVVVRAPLFVARADIDQFVRSKARWVLGKLTQQQAQINALPERSYCDGGRLPFLGGELVLVVRSQSRAQVIRYGDQLLVYLANRSRLDLEEQARRLVSTWYQEQALKLLAAKTDAAVAQLGVKHSGVTIRATRSKWGHCTSKGAIQYNWQILLAPEPIVDYLVAHETSHLLHLNHSPAFWAVVASICPDYKKRRAWLKANGMQLVL